MFVCSESASLSENRKFSCVRGITLLAWIGEFVGISKQKMFADPESKKAF
jgi:hypothetical protein